MDKETQDAILRAIQTEGAALEENKRVNIVLGSRVNLQHIVNLSSGMSRIKPSVSKAFTLILAQPLSLSALSTLSIRCALCGKVISYPAWYISIRYVTNWFHYFVCFDETDSSKVTARCYRRI